MCDQAGHIFKQETAGYHHKRHPLLSGNVPGTEKDLHELHGHDPPVLEQLLRLDIRRGLYIPKSNETTKENQGTADDQETILPGRNGASAL